MCACVCVCVCVCVCYNDYVKKDKKNSLSLNRNHSNIFCLHDFTNERLDVRIETVWQCFLCCV